ncbi:hypothetical protein N7492_004219 [Penicillium capsulatum]|uniref:Uncharacterized protein n=1 Tax=Penicillium capsulatum TaxID=69766 RepID=A0A9W9LQI8_9EURO|nr:hypothetical protein N7492_004219 [Penicillium capsulatum]KAJ6136658.1 hypothetical protein N7512_001818 [Penicillium capsulatum]
MSTTLKLIIFKEQLLTLNQSLDRSHSVARLSSKLDKILDENTIYITPLTFWREHQTRFLAIATLTRDALSFSATGAGVE